MKRQLTSHSPTKRQMQKQQDLEEAREHAHQCTLLQADLNKIGTLGPRLIGISCGLDLPGNVYQDLVNCFPTSVKLMILYNTIKTKLLHMGGHCTENIDNAYAVPLDIHNNQAKVSFKWYRLGDERMRYSFYFRCRDIQLLSDYTKDKETESSFDETVFKKWHYPQSHRILSIMLFATRVKELLATLPSE